MALAFHKNSYVVWPDASLWAAHPVAYRVFMEIQSLGKLASDNLVEARFRFPRCRSCWISRYVLRLYSNKHNARVINPESNQQVQNGVHIANGGDQEMGTVNNNVHFHSHHHGPLTKDGTKLLRYRVIAMVLELGIIVHSIVIGISLGASNNTCTIKGLVAALCFHQMFEGMGLGGCILQAEYKKLKKGAMAFFFSVTTPFGIAIGIGLSKTYQENSPRALITVGLLNATSAGLLIYMALVDLLAADFMGDKLQASIKLQIKAFVAVLLGAGGMSLMAKWA